MWNEFSVCHSTTVETFPSSGDTNKCSLAVWECLFPIGIYLLHFTFQKGNQDLKQEHCVLKSKGLFDALDFTIKNYVHTLFLTPRFMRKYTTFIQINFVLYN